MYFTYKVRPDNFLTMFVVVRFTVYCSFSKLQNDYLLAFMEGCRPQYGFSKSCLVSPKSGVFS
jgi:hypothetical protein